MGDNGKRKRRSRSAYGHRDRKTVGLTLNNSAKTYFCETPVTPSDIIDGDIESLDQIDNLPDRWQRRVLRGALHTRDTLRLRSLVNKGLDINMVISEVFWDTPLTYAVKCGYLEVVEMLVEMAQCDINQKDRNNHSPLDEAIRTWLIGASVPCRAKQDHGRRYRILKCLLRAGATDISLSFLDMLVFSAKNRQAGHILLTKLAKVFCDKGCAHVKSILLSVLVSYQFAAPQLQSLAMSGASPLYYLDKDPARPYMPMDNAIVLLKTTSCPTMLARIECDTGCNLSEMDSQWSSYRLVVKLLTLSGHAMQQLFILNHLYRNHAELYAWLIKYWSRPRRLQHLSRLAVRRQLDPNVEVGLQKLSLPQPLKSYLLFSELGV